MGITTSSAGSTGVKKNNNVYYCCAPLTHPRQPGALTPILSTSVKPETTDYEAYSHLPRPLTAVSADLKTR